MSRVHVRDRSAAKKKGRCTLGRQFDSGVDRRGFMKLAAAVGAGVVLDRGGAVVRAAGAGAAGNSVAPVMARFPEKGPMILLTDRPPQLEMPSKYFLQDVTPNDAFFVRWHLAGIPTSVDTKAFRLKVGGHVGTELALSVDELRSGFEAASVTAVCQCSGNSRSLFEPRVVGGQWGNGAVGNAKWTGVRLKDLLTKAGAKAGAVDVSFAGLDEAPLADTPKFVKSLSMEKANEPDILVAYEMNGRPLPMLNGFPLRLIVPGWYATYWVKSLNAINVLDKKFDGFWMAKAYRIPNNPEARETPGDLAKDTVPISVMSVRALFGAPANGASVTAGKAVAVGGVAFDGGSGIKSVEVSADGGKTWAAAALGEDQGKYSWRRWSYDWTPSSAGNARLMARAVNNDGVGQSESMWNRSGYQRNVIEHVDVTVA